ncbi:MAG: hypothetical protein LC663_00395, partial [Actinobacteria bacterium]|nr:hypothetical protein [Actinomycetota bacterium]
LYDRASRARFDDLSFSHFQAVAGLEDRLLWLERARRGEWSVARLVAYSRRAGAAPKPVELRVRRPLEAAARQIAKIAEIDQRTLTKAARLGLEEALNELEQQVELLRARFLQGKTPNGHRALRVAR